MSPSAQSGGNRADLVVLDLDVDVDVVVAGLGLGAVAAALALAEAGRSVVLAGPETRIGGQVTAQLTSPLDEHPLIEITGCTSSYRRFRDLTRAEHDGVANPGGGWVSRLCFEPHVGQRVLERMLASHVEAGRVRVVTSARPLRVEREGDRITGVVFATPIGPRLFTGRVTIDATETGDLLPLAGADWIVGSEGRHAFDEPHALPGGPDPRAEQSCTIVAALVREAEPQPVGDAPPGYAELRDEQPFSLSLSNHAGHLHRYAMYDDAEPPGSFWSYRRVRDADATGGGREAAIINWHGNDWYGSPLTAEAETTEAAARRLAAAFVHWLRTEAPRDGGGRGHPELRLAPELSGTPDGFAETPYVRESRRLRSARPVTEHDLAPVPGRARAAAMPDSAGVAWYHADLHPRVGGHPSVYAPTAPFQVPLSALVAARPANLVAGAKNLAATQVAAAAYRVHPGEWAVGEAAGVLASVAIDRDVAPAAVADDAVARLAVQVALLRRGAPLVWATDLAPSHPAFLAGSLLAAHDGLDASRLSVLELRPDDEADDGARAALADAARRLAATVGIDPPTSVGGPATWGEVATTLARPLLERLAAVGAPDTLPLHSHHAPRTTEIE